MHQAEPHPPGTSRTVDATPGISQRYVHFRFDLVVQVALDFLFFRILQNSRSLCNFFYEGCVGEIGVLLVEAWSPFGSRPREYSGEVTSFMLNETGGQYRQLFPDALRSRNLWFMHRDFTAYARTPREVGWGFHAWRQPE